ncbi:MAG TPA: YciI family protein [Candidatus Binatia bacterium]|nr:YciI family protein [Candidatus Binatia bacterium]
MLYTILCYNDEKVTTSWTKAEDDAVMARLGTITQRLVSEGKLGPVARLQPTGQATTLRKSKNGPVVTDGPFAETKEHLLGFYIVDCASIDDVVEIAKELQAANAGPSSYEIRPVMFYVGTDGKPASAA